MPSTTSALRSAGGESGRSVKDRVGRLTAASAKRVIEPDDEVIGFKEMVHPGVYATVGLPPFETWRRANATPVRRQLRYDSTRPVLEVLLNAGALARGRIPRAWMHLCGVDSSGTSVDVA
jgi:hypothetical protein